MRATATGMQPQRYGRQQELLAISPGRQTVAVFAWDALSAL